MVSFSETGEVGGGGRIQTLVSYIIHLRLLRYPGRNIKATNLRCISGEISEMEIPCGNCQPSERLEAAGWI